MAMARASRSGANVLTRLARVALGSRSASVVSRPSWHFSSALSPFNVGPAFSTPSLRSLVIPSPGGLALIVRSPALPPIAAVSPYLSIIVRSYAKRPKKWQGGRHALGPYALVQVEPGAPCPSSSPNAGSVRNRKLNKRMAQRAAFIKEQAHKRKQQTKAALIKRDAARRKRWRQGAARARAWAKHLQEQERSSVSA